MTRSRSASPTTPRTSSATSSSSSSPSPGSALTKGDAFGVVESVKAVSDLYAPIDGEVVAANTDLVDAPEGINGDAYGSWLIKVKPANAADVDGLLDAAAYAELLEKEAK